jgi:hypothetical protein
MDKVWLLNRVKRKEILDFFLQIKSCKIVVLTWRIVLRFYYLLVLELLYV